MYAVPGEFLGQLHRFRIIPKGNVFDVETRMVLFTNKWPRVACSSLNFIVDRRITLHIGPIKFRYSKAVRMDVRYTLTTLPCKSHSR